MPDGLPFPHGLIFRCMHDRCPPETDSSGLKGSGSGMAIIITGGTDTGPGHAMGIAGIPVTGEKIPVGGTGNREDGSGEKKG